jgi:hypothetical protein
MSEDESLTIVRAIERLEVHMQHIHKDLQSHLDLTKEKFEKHDGRLTDLEHSKTRLRTIIIGGWTVGGLAVILWVKQALGI